VEHPGRTAPRMRTQVNTTDSDETPQVRRGPFREWWLSVLAVVTLAALATAVILLRNRITINVIKGYGYGGAFLISFLAGSTILIYVPGDPAIFAFGGVLSPWLVGICAGVGEAIGELLGYLFGRGGRGFIQRQIDSRLGHLYSRIEDQVQRRGPLVIFLAACILNPLYDMFGIAAGMLGMPAWKFFVSCCAGKIVKDTYIALLGAWGMGYILGWFGIAI